MRHCSDVGPTGLIGRQRMRLQCNKSSSRNQARPALHITFSRSLHSGEMPTTAKAANQCIHVGCIVLLKEIEYAEDWHAF
jgi:hypothetical protein